MDAILRRQMLDYYNERAPEYEEANTLGTGTASIRDPSVFTTEATVLAGIVRQFALGRLMDLACGTGYWLPHYAAGASSITLFDQSEKMLAECRKKVQRHGLGNRVALVRGDFFEYKFDAAAYDCALVGFFLSHLTAEQQALVFAALRKMLVPPGRFLILDSAWSPERAQVNDKVGRQERRLNDGTRFEVYKRYFDRRTCSVGRGGTKRNWVSSTSARPSSPSPAASMPDDEDTATHMPALLIVTPQADEAEALCRGFARNNLGSQRVKVGLLDCTLVPSLDALVAVGGNGKAQFAVQAQHLLDRSRDTRLLCCVGAAGRLHGDLSLGDVVVATCTIEHDYTERFVQEPLPCHDSHAGVLSQLRQIVAAHEFPFRVHFGPIASGDEDIVDAGRAAEVFAATNALCVAWEGSGGARAARFSGVAFVEIRAISDAADDDAARSFHENLATVLPNVGDLLVAWHFGTQAEVRFRF